jgi:hypothetical protein
MRGHVSRIKAWDLEITDKFPLQPGYSGSPVVDEYGKVIGVVNTRLGDGKTGVAISIEALEQIWLNRPSDAKFAPVHPKDEEYADPHVPWKLPLLPAASGLVGRDKERRETDALRLEALAAGSNAEMLSVEEQSVPPACPETPGTPKPTSLAPHESETAPAVFAAVFATKRRRSPANTIFLSYAKNVFLILLALIFLGGIGFAIYYGGPGLIGVLTGNTSGPADTLYRVARSGSQLMAVGVQGTILTSSDGHTWTTQNVGTTNTLSGVARSDSQFVVVGDQGTILTSPDGHTWTTQNAGTSNNLIRVAWSGSQFVVVGDHGTILTSPNGRTWTTQNVGTTNTLSGVARSDSQFVVVGDQGTILTSPDGHTWTLISP